MKAYEKLPFTEGELASELLLIEGTNSGVQNWPGVYAGLLDACFPNVMSQQEWENRLRATGRQHHMYQNAELKGVRNADWARWYAHDFVTRYNEGKPLYDHVKVAFDKTTRNGPLLMGEVLNALQVNEVSVPAQEQFLGEAGTGGFDEVLKTSDRYVSVT